jgi:integrase
VGYVRNRKGRGRGYEARWYDPSSLDANGKPKQRSRTFATQAEARQFIRAVEGDKVRGSYIPPDLAKTPFAEVARRWFGAKEREWTPKTRAGYESILRKLIDEFGARPIGGVEAGAVEEFLGAQDLAAGTRRNILRVLSPIMQHAVKLRMIPRNPVLEVDKPKLSRDRRPREAAFLTPFEVRGLAQEIGEPYDLVIYFAAYTGARAGEIGALRVRHLDLPNRRVRIEESVSDVNGHLHSGKPKNGRWRDVGLTTYLVNRLDEHVAGRRPSDFVFTDSRGGQLRHGNFYARSFRPAVARLVAQGVWSPDKGDFRFHELRHTCASVLIHLGVHPKAVSEWLGHSSISITMDRYGHLYRDHQEAILTKLDGVFEDAARAELDLAAVGSLAQA